MERWAAADVLAASKAIDDAWPQPAGMEVVENDDFYAICLPAHLSSPTSGRVQVWTKSQRTFTEIRPEVERVAQEWGAEEVWWRVAVEVDVATDEALRHSDAELVMTELLMARSLEGVDADAWLVSQDPPGAATKIVTDKASFRSLSSVETTGWGRTPPSSEVLAEEWEQFQVDNASSSAFAFLVSAEGVPASVGRCALFGPVVRLFGAVTLSAFRGRGLYAAVLKARCQLGREHGATLALTRGRPSTSAPMLQRAGFDSYQTEESWRLHIDDSR